MILNNYTQASPDAQAGVSSTPADPSLADSFNKIDSCNTASCSKAVSYNDIIIKAYHAGARWLDKLSLNRVAIYRHNPTNPTCFQRKIIFTDALETNLGWQDTTWLHGQLSKTAIPIVEHDIVRHDIVKPDITDDQVAEWVISYAGLPVDLDPIVINPTHLNPTQVQALAEAQAEGAEWFMVVGDEIVVYRTHAIPFCSDYEYASIWPPIDDSPDTLIWLDYDGSLPDRVIELKTYFEPINSDNIVVNGIYKSKPRPEKCLKR